MKEKELEFHHGPAEIAKALSDALYWDNPKLWNELKREGKLEPWLRSKGRLMWRELVMSVEERQDENLVWERLVHKYLLHPYP